MLDQNPSPKRGESKHERFLRLMQRRLERALEELRLVSQLASPNYENTPQEAEEVIRHLDGAIIGIAQSFEVPYSTAIGAAAARRAQATGHLVTTAFSTAGISEIDIVKAMELIKADRSEDAHEFLRSLLIQEKR